ncbi:hypothetical protein [Burkholderia ubonensis]|uniref:hypothetical protein n=1 Tax=Burkholderia ubonensis TaxID=101571 RepID=UPI0012F77F21|nr:hypothetical protein [Burkholderia ubonensis]
MTATARSPAFAPSYFVEGVAYLNAKAPSWATRRHAIARTPVLFWLVQTLLHGLGRIQTDAAAAPLLRCGYKWTEGPAPDPPIRLPPTRNLSSDDLS